MPFTALFGLDGVGSGTFALTILSLMLAGRLYATKGGWGNTWPGKGLAS